MRVGPGVRVVCFCHLVGVSAPGCFSLYLLRKGDATTSTPDTGTVPGTFQSSPPPKRGCNPQGRLTMSGTWASFQSSPPPKRGCNTEADERADLNYQVSILTPSEKGVQPVRLGRHSGGSEGFNPHPLRKGGATSASLMRSCNTIRKFQSSPPPKRGCNVRVLDEVLQHHPEVSILTPSEKGVQHASFRFGLWMLPVSILTPSEKGVQPGRRCWNRGPPSSFNPHPLRKGGATMV